MSRDRSRPRSPYECPGFGVEPDAIERPEILHWPEKLTAQNRPKIDPLFGAVDGHDERIGVNNTEGDHAMNWGELARESAECAWK
jgi:hypothetical protein